MWILNGKLFNRILHDMFLSVQKEFGNPEDPPTGFKGDNVKIKQIAKRVCLDLGDMKSRKRRNWIARSETFLQKVQLHPQFTHSKEYMVLKRKLGNHDIPALKAQIEKLAFEEQSYRNALTQARISKWKHDMQTNSSSRAQWLKRTEKGCQPTIVSADKPCHLRTEIFQAIRDHWQDVWTKAKNISPLSRSDKLRLDCRAVPGTVSCTCDTASIRS